MEGQAANAAFSAVEYPASPLRDAATFPRWLQGGQILPGKGIPGLNTRECPFILFSRAISLPGVICPPLNPAGEGMRLKVTGMRAPC